MVEDGFIKVARTPESIPVDWAATEFEERAVNASTVLEVDA
ncbi:hypothetical protein DP62_5936 [Burkholderia pseudomallei]|nr:hypothetical protein DP62_5936 [Burkholderia pseudomallei]